MKKILLIKILDIFEKNIIPLTIKGVSIGNKIFGAAILNKKDYKLVIAGNNNEIDNPIWHGEIDTIKKFYKIPKKIRPLTKDCLFISSHEPCSLCLSAITWCGFDNFYFLFPYEDTNNKFNIPHDLKILKEVFNIKKGKYIDNNYYWKSYNLNDYIFKLKKNDQLEILHKLTNIKNIYIKLSKQYQQQKQKNEIILK